MGARHGPGVIRHIRLGDRYGGLRLEPLMWQALVDIARRQARDVDALLAEIDRDRTVPSLTAAVRMYVVAWCRTAPGNSARPAARRPQLRVVLQNI